MVPLTFLEQQSQHHHLLFLWCPILETEVRRPKCSTSGCLQRHHGGWVLLPRVFFFKERFTFFKHGGEKTSKSIVLRNETQWDSAPSEMRVHGGQALMCTSVLQRGRLQHLRIYLSCWFWVSPEGLICSEQDLVQLMGTLWNSVFEREFDTDAVNPWGMA